MEEKIADIGSALPFDVMKSAIVPNYVMNLIVTDRDYLLLICMLDMFLNKAKSHPMAKLKVITIVCRYYGFASYMDLAYLG